MRVISAINIKDGRVDDANVRFITRDLYARWMPVPLRGGDVLLTSEAPLGEVAFWAADSEAALGQRLFALRAKGGLTDGRFLYYWLMSNGAQSQIHGRATGTTVGGIRQSELVKIRIPLPLLTTQRAIGELLGALDDKIDSNVRIEQVAHGLRDAEYARTVRNQEWPLVPLSRLVAINNRKVTPGAADEHLEYIDIGSVRPGHVIGVRLLAWGEAPGRARRAVQDGDVIYSTVRPDRRAFALLLDPSPNTVVSTGFATLTPVGVGLAYLSALTADPSFAAYLSSSAEGSAYPAVSPESMGRYEVALPATDVLDRFEDDMTPVLRRADRARRESTTLATLRDVLLPELLSGRLTLPEARDHVESVR